MKHRQPAAGSDNPVSEDLDAQRLFQQRALRNVRALVDKVSQPQMGLLSALLWMAIIGGAILAAVLVAYWVDSSLLRRERWVGKDSVLPQKVVAQPATGTRCTDPGGPAWSEAMARSIQDRSSKGVPTAIGNAQGKVHLTFAILPDGSIGEVKVVEGSGNAALDAAAIEYVRSSSPCAPVAGRSPSEAGPVAIRPVILSFSRPTSS